MDRVRRDFDAIARLGDADESTSSRYDDFLVAAVPEGAARVLDIGCGSGRLSAQLARPGRDVVALDLSPEMIRLARERLAGVPGIRLVCGDFLALDLGAGFDCIVTATALHHMPAEIALPGMIELVKPGGRLIIHDMRTTAGPAEALSAYAAVTGESVRRLLRTGSPLPPRHVRRAWKQHGASESYLTLAQARALADRFLPNARLYSHRAWRYTLVWDRADG